MSFLSRSKLLIATFLICGVSTSLAQTSFHGVLPATVFPDHGVHYNTRCQVQFNLEEDADRFFVRDLTFQCDSLPAWTESIRLYKKNRMLYDATGTAQGFIHDTGTYQFEMNGQATYYLQKTKRGWNMIRDNSAVRMKGVLN